MKYILLCSLILLSGCSFKTAPNQWQYKSANAFSSYTKNFLSDNQILADNDLSRAVQHAKKSADFTQLATIYLGECALNISLGIEDKCEKYKNIQELVNNEELNAYYAFITRSISHEDIKLLPQHYQVFALSFNKSDFKKANTELLRMEKETSRLLCASLLKNKIDKEVRTKIIQTASFYGYKKAVLFWLGELLKNTSDLGEVKNIERKIAILKSN
jgi:hypothetical protein